MAVLSEYFPRVQRMAYALSGREEMGRQIVRQVVRRSLRVMPRWTHPADASRWFVHHTLLASRQKWRSPIDLATDPLIRGVATTSAYYPAFIGALRALPMQQREAYLLHHGERLDVRGLAIAMDCSREAAENHLREAGAALSAYAGGYFPAFTAQLAQTYDRLSPEEELIVPAIRAVMRGGVWAVARRCALTTLKVLFLGAVVFVAWRIVPMLRW